MDGWTIYNSVQYEWVVPVELSVHMKSYTRVVVVFFLNKKDYTVNVHIQR